MAKIRGVKPEFWTDEDIVELSIPARLLFIGMWNFACDNGHLDDKPKQIKMRVLPADDVNVEDLLAELMKFGRISRHDGTIEIHRFAEHQKPHKRWWQVCDQPWCTVPDGATSHPPNRGTTVAQPLQHGGATADGDGDGDGDGELMVKGRKRPATKLPESWKPTPEHLERAMTTGVVLGEQVERFRLHAETHDRRAANWNAAFTQWLIKAAEFAERDRPAEQRQRPHASQLELPPDGLTPDEYAAWEFAQRQKRRA